MSLLLLVARLLPAVVTQAFRLVLAVLEWLLLEWLLQVELLAVRLPKELSLAECFPRADWQVPMDWLA